MNISYEQIRAFVAVAESGSFSAAARQLNRHRTTLGQVISNLEIEINMTLFDRTGKSPRLTEHGEALYRHAKSLSGSSTAFESLCQSIESGIESDITIYHSDLVPIGMIRSTMQGIRDEFAHVNIHWLHRSNEEAKRALQSGDADLGIVLHHHSSSISPRDNVYLMNMQFKVVAAPNFFADNAKSLRIHELSGYRQLLLEDYFYAQIEEIMTVSAAIQRIENMNILLELLKLGDGWAVVPSHTVVKDIELGMLIEIDVQELNALPRFPLSILYMNQSHYNPVRKRIIELLTKYAKPYEH